MQFPNFRSSSYSSKTVSNCRNFIPVTQLLPSPDNSSIFTTISNTHRWNTEKCIFMDKRVREISRFFVVPQREFAPAVWRVSRTLLSRNTSISVNISSVGPISYLPFSTVSYSTPRIGPDDVGRDYGTTCCSSTLAVRTSFTATHF